MFIVTIYQFIVTIYQQISVENGGQDVANGEVEPHSSDGSYEIKWAEPWSWVCYRVLFSCRVTSVCNVFSKYVLCITFYSLFSACFFTHLSGSNTFLLFGTSGSVRQYTATTALQVPNESVAKGKTYMVLCVFTTAAETAYLSPDVNNSLQPTTVNTFCLGSEIQDGDTQANRATQPTQLWTHSK